MTEDRGWERLEQLAQAYQKYRISKWDENSRTTRYKERVASGEKFFMIAKSQRSRLGDVSKFLIKQTVVADVVKELGALAKRHPTLLEPTLYVVRNINNAAGDKDFWGRLFEKAGEAMQKKFYNLERKGSPEGYRESELYRDFTLREKTELLLCLEKLLSWHTLRSPLTDGSAIMKLAKEVRK